MQHTVSESITAAEWYQSRPYLNPLTCPRGHGRLVIERAGSEGDRKPLACPVCSYSQPVPQPVIDTYHRRDLIERANPTLF